MRSDTNMKKVGRVTVFLLKIDVNFADLNRGQLAKAQRKRRLLCNALPDTGDGLSGRVRKDMKTPTADADNKFTCRLF